MSVSIEEGSPLLEKEVAAPVKVSRRGPMVLAAALATLATTACVGYYSSFSKPSAGFVGVVPMDFHVKAMQLDDSGSKRNKLATTTNEACKASVVLAGPGPFDYLVGLKTELPIYPLLAPDAVDNEYSIRIDLFNKIEKVSYNEDGTDRHVVKLGHMVGLNHEANIIAVDGDYCATLKGPYHSYIPVICGREFEIRELENKSPCWFVVKVAHPRQCTDKVKVIGGWPEKYAAEQRVDAVYSGVK